MKKRQKKKLMQLVVAIVIALASYVITLMSPPIAHENLTITVVDQTTPNMIQRISGIFERNPLIYEDI